ncbi:I78 family peptidase inhibitor [Jannaschia donghaensis]|uniref:Peptidase inhibitor I78 family protein n=1 Tax=Jannaschia donghaensis TaxID=420998 RepID=A0A0M6YJN7_9RHOB|nr:I78 family peptidase inhibitor [Jannaschia donghaensis]CTQ49276.1 Peptidase inhibitor I78 family protein [Jannaschia donghaensis]
MKPTVFFLLTLTALAGCKDDRVAAAPPDACGAQGYRSLIGTPLAAVTLPADLDMRIVGPGRIGTTDYRPERLNIEVDEAGTITDLSCG